MSTLTKKFVKVNNGGFFSLCNVFINNEGFIDMWVFSYFFLSKL